MEAELINTLLMKLKPISGGYDPVPLTHAREYARRERAIFNPVMIDLLETRMGGFQGKRILDLGGGPGHFAIEFARRGGIVTWHDVSRNYRTITQEHARAQGVELDCSLGYFEEAERFLSRPFDLVFNRICWMYCADDTRFAALFRALIRPGGWGYINHGCGIPPRSLNARARFHFNALTGLKIGHVDAPTGRLERLFRRFGDLEVEITTLPPNEHLYLRRL